MRGVAMLLLATTSASAALAGQLPTTREVIRRVSVSGGTTSVRHRVYVTNKSQHRLVQTVVLGLYPGLREVPKQQSGPAGWRSRVYQQPNRRDGAAWAVEFTCLPASGSDSGTGVPDPGPGSSGSTTSCGIGAEETASFDVVLVGRSPTLEVGPVGVIFSDGEAATTVE